MKYHSAVLEYPFMMYTFVEDGRKRCQVDFLVYTMDMSNYRVSMNAKGDVLSLKTAIPQFFYGAERMDKANSNNSDYSSNTHKAISFVQSVGEAEKHINGSDELVGESMKVKVPFQCDPDEYK
jgi:hypothetical protein